MPFDFRASFNLDTGTIDIDLSPNTANMAGVAGITSQVVTPVSTIVSPGYAFVPPYAPTDIYSVVIPKVQGVYVWGLYTITLTLSTPLYQPVTKTFNLCAVNSADPFANEQAGSYSIMVDCCAGAINVRDMAGYAYKQQQPVSQVFNITRYYPVEAELAPEKNISYLPFSVDAYSGTNTFKGKATSTYDFGNNLFAVVNTITRQEKDVRCVVDYNSILCGMQSLVKQLSNCNATPAEYNTAFGPINALLWIVMAGEEIGADVSEEILALEKLLGVECSCSGCAGTKIGQQGCSGSSGGGAPAGPAAGDLNGEYPAPLVQWGNGLSTYDSRYINGAVFTDEIFVL